MANGNIGVKGWRQYSTFSLFAGSSQRADRNTSILVDTSSGNLSVLATDWNLAARIPCSLSRAYNHQDTDTTTFDRPFGPGWYWQFDMNLTGSMNGTGNVTWKAADGSEYEFTYAAGPVWTAPAGMHDYTLTFDSGPTPDRYIITVGTMKYIFEVNATQSIARLVRIEDAFGNALNVVRVYNTGEPTFEIDKIQIEYDNSGPATHDIVEFTYNGSLITKLRLLDTVDSGDYIDLHYTYDNIDSEDRLIKVEPKFGTTALNLEVEYNYDSGDGLQMTELFDTEGSKNSYNWSVTYSTGKVASIVFPVDATPTTGTVAYGYGVSAPASWSHASPNAWNTVTDAESNVWYYGQDSSGRVQFAVDPLWVNSTHESFTEYGYNADNQVTSVKTPRPNAESGQLTTSFYYNSNKYLAAVVDAYGFVSWYKYGSRASYDAGGTGATVKEVIGIFTPMPGQKAYDDSDHTSSETAPPSLSSPVNVDSFVSWDSGNGYWEYTDGNTNVVKLVRTVNDYTFTTGTGKLTQLLSASPENFGEGTATSYTLTTASAASKQEYDATTGDLYRSYTPRQFQDSNLKYSQFAYSQVYGSMTSSANADGVLSNPTTPPATEYEHDATGTLTLKVKLPEDTTDQWTEYLYDNRWFQTGVKRPDVNSWGVDPIVSVTDYDDNGNVTAQWQAKIYAAGVPLPPAAYNGNTGGGSYVQPAGYTYDRINRVTQQDTIVTLSGSLETLSTYFKYDKNGNTTRVKGPEFDVSGTPNFTYNFTDYDELNRPVKVYNAEGSSNSNLTTPSGGTKFVQYLYSVAGGTTAVQDQLYTSGDAHKVTYTYDWLGRQIQTQQAYQVTPSVLYRTTRQHFDAAGLLYWSEDGEGYKMWPEYDLNGRQVSLHRGTAGGDGDLREYDADGNLLHLYTYEDVNADSSEFRWRYKYDALDRRVNDGREQYTGGSWQNWNSNTADTSFDLNGNVYRSYDKVNSGKYTERVYDDWQQLIEVKLPAVPNPAGGGDIVYTNENTYDVLGRRWKATDARSNDTEWEYDELGRVVKVTDAKGYETETRYDTRGNRSELHASAGAITYFTYNGRGLLTETKVSHDSTNDITSYVYDEMNRQTEVTYPDGGETTTQYDLLGRREETSVLLSGSDYLTTAYSFNLNNQVTLVSMPGSYTMSYVYDDLGNLTQLTDTNGDDTDYTYDHDNRRKTEDRPNALVTTWSYDWKTRQVASVLQELNTTSGDDITVSYTYDDNGQVISITDGLSASWYKGYDALGRMSRLGQVSVPTYEFAIVRDGNGNITRTTDFKSTEHWYQYDELNRMTGHGASSSADDEIYEWGCCTKLVAYDDNFGTAALVYDDLARLTEHTDSQGNVVEYTYDSMSRVASVTPAQGTNFRTVYTYNKNGSLATLAAYDSGTAETTAYTYNTTSGKLTQRNLPASGGNNMRTAYAYDAAGRLEYETVTRETSGGTTNLYRTQYAYAYIAAGSGGGRSLTRTETTWGGSSWDNDNKVLYEWNALEWLRYEQRHDWVTSAWSAVYDVAQEYDKNGNRTRYHKNVQGLAADYGISYDLSYTFNSKNFLTGILDTDNPNYGCVVTCDLNNNITEVVESMRGQGGTPENNFLYTYFDYDDLNRLTAHRTKAYNGLSWIWTKREHAYDALGRAAASGYKQWVDGGLEPGPTTVEHVYDQSGRFVQNYDGSSTYGQVWHWAGAEPLPPTSGPLKSPNADTVRPPGYNESNNVTPQRRTYLSPTTEGDERTEWGQGRPQAKDASGSGSNWAVGTQSQPQNGNMNAVESRTMFEGTVTTGLDRATDAREKGRIGIFGTGLSYAGSYSRVTSEAIGRDLNPLGRGDGNAYVAGWMNLGVIAPRLPQVPVRRGNGNSVNNFTLPCLTCGMKDSGEGGWPKFGERIDASKVSCCDEQCGLGCCSDVMPLAKQEPPPGVPCPCCPKKECGGDCQGVAGEITMVDCPHGKMECDLTYHPCQDYSGQDCKCDFGEPDCGAWFNKVTSLITQMPLRAQCCLDRIDSKWRQCAADFLHNLFKNYPVCCCTIVPNTKYMPGGQTLDPSYIPGATRRFQASCTNDWDLTIKRPSNRNDSCQEICLRARRMPFGLTTTAGEQGQNYTGVWFCFDAILKAPHQYRFYYSNRSEGCHFMAIVIHEGMRVNGCRGKEYELTQGISGLEQFINCLCHEVERMSKGLNT